MTVYDSGPVPLFVRVAVLPFLAMGSWMLPQVLREQNVCGGLALLGLLYLFVGVWRFRERLVFEPDGRVVQIHQGIVFRWIRRIRWEELGGVRIRTGRGVRGRPSTELEVFRTNGKAWYGTAVVPEEARDLAAALARDLGLTVAP